MDEYEWKPYHPTDEQVHSDVDVLTAPFNDTSKNSTKVLVRGEPTIVPYPFLEDYAYFDDGSKIESGGREFIETEKEATDCPQPHCRCVCDPL